MSDDIGEALEAANEAFASPPANPETGLEYVEGEELLLRKACRLRAALSELAAVNGYYTLTIEVSFAIIERSMKYYVGSRGQVLDTIRTGLMGEMGVRARTESSGWPSEQHPEHPRPGRQYTHVAI